MTDQPSSPRNRHDVPPTNSGPKTPKSISSEQHLQLWTYGPGDEIVFYRVTGESPVPLGYAPEKTTGDVGDETSTSEPDSSTESKSSKEPAEPKSSGRARYRHGIGPDGALGDETSSKEAHQAGLNIEEDTSSPDFPAEKIPSGIAATVVATMTYGGMRHLILDLKPEIEENLPDCVTGAVLRTTNPVSDGLISEADTTDSHATPVLDFNTECPRSQSEQPDIPPVAITLARCHNFGKPDERNPAQPLLVGKVDYMGTEAYSIIKQDGDMRLLKPNPENPSEETSETIEISDLETLARMSLTEFRDFVDRGAISPLTEQSKENISQV